MGFILAALTACCNKRAFITPACILRRWSIKDKSSKGFRRGGGGGELDEDEEGIGDEGPE